MRARLTIAIRQNIKQYGWHVMTVFPHEDDSVKTWFCYTVGLFAKQQHPELIVFGLQPRVAHAVFSEVRDRVIAGQRFTNGQIVRDLVQGDFPILFLKAPNDDPDYPTSGASAYYGHDDYPVLHLVLSDADKRFPWDPKCAPHMALTQQLLGPVVAP
jgi:hypothetical protein